MDLLFIGFIMLPNHLFSFTTNELLPVVMYYPTLNKSKWFHITVEMS